MLLDSKFAYEYDKHSLQSSMPQEAARLESGRSSLRDSSQSSTGDRRNATTRLRQLNPFFAGSVAQPARGYVGRAAQTRGGGSTGFVWGEDRLQHGRRSILSRGGGFQWRWQARSRGGEY